MWLSLTHVCIWHADEHDDTRMEGWMDVTGGGGGGDV
jgi:hypothetical protein